MQQAALVRRGEQKDEGQPALALAEGMPCQLQLQPCRQLQAAQAAQHPMVLPEMTNQRPWLWLWLWQGLLPPEAFQQAVGWRAALAQEMVTWARRLLWQLLSWTLQGCDMQVDLAHQSHYCLAPAAPELHRLIALFYGSPLHLPLVQMPFQELPRAAAERQAQRQKGAGAALAHACWPHFSAAAPSSGALKTSLGLLPLQSQMW